MWENILKILQRYGDVYLEGLAGTLWIAALTVVAGTVIGIILAVFRLGKCRPCEWFVRFYIWIIRGTPSLLQLGFIMRTPRGRVVTALGCEHMGYPASASGALHQQLRMDVDDLESEEDEP